jgi:hypothetical protein
MATTNKDTWIKDIEINTEFVNVIMNGEIVTAGLTEQELYALDILKILVQCLPAERIAVFMHRWEFCNHCGCELDKVCLVHFCDELTAWIFDISGHDDSLSEDNMHARMKNWRSDMTNDEYKAVKAYLLGHERASYDARWAECWKLLFSSRASRPHGYDYASNSWVVDEESMPTD